MFNPPLDPWPMQQLTHYLISLLRKECSDCPNTPVENVCLVKAPSAHGISEMYKLLVQSSEGYAPGFLQKWERDLNITLSEEQQRYILHFTHHSSMAPQWLLSTKSCVIKFSHAGIESHHCCIKCIRKGRICAGVVVWQRAICSIFFGCVRNCRHSGPRSEI